MLSWPLSQSSGASGTSSASRHSASSHVLGCSPALPPPAACRRAVWAGGGAKRNALWGRVPVAAATALAGSCSGGGGGSRRTTNPGAGAGGDWTGRDGRQRAGFPKPRQFLPKSPFPGCPSPFSSGATSTPFSSPFPWRLWGPTSTPHATPSPGLPLPCHQLFHGLPWPAPSSSPRILRACQQPPD